MIRLFSLLVLLALAAAVGTFAYQNAGAVDVQFLTWGRSAPLAAVVGAGYVLGMLSGWAVVGVFRSSLRRVAESRDASR